MKIIESQLLNLKFAYGFGMEKREQEFFIPQDFAHKHHQVQG
jgi:hypothetical protein